MQIRKSEKIVLTKERVELLSDLFSEFSVNTYSDMIMRMTHRFKVLYQFRRALLVLHYLCNPIGDDPELS